MYCGGKALPKNKRFGSEENCKRQVRLYGHIQVKNPVYLSLKLNGKNPVYCGAKKTSRKHGTVEQCKKSKQLRRYGLFTIDKNLPSKPKSTQISRKTQKNKAANKIGAIFKGQKEKKKFVQLMKNVNAAQQRRRQLLKRMLEKENQFTGEKLLLPNNIVSNMKIVSHGETGSGAVVAVLKTKNHGIMACKLTRYNPKEKEDPGWHEVKMYNLLNNLVDDNVTPFILKNIVFKYAMDANTLHPKVINRMKSKHIFKQYHALLTESVDGKNMYTLYDTIGLLPRKTIQALMFQVLWTLECFNRIGVRHNDLHLENIFVFKHNRPQNTYRIFKYKDEKNIQHVLYVPTTEYEVRVFDFDRAAKRKLTSHKYKKKYTPAISFKYTRDLFMKRHTLSNKNHQFDTFKFMQHIGECSRHFVFDGPKWKSHLDDTTMEAMANVYNYNENDFYDFFLPVTTEGKDPQIEGYPTTVSLIQQISQLLHFYEKPKTGQLVEIYDMDNIYK